MRQNMLERSNPGKYPNRSRLVELGQRFYDEKLKSELEPAHNGRFVAIEPESGQYFLHDNGTAALIHAHDRLPGRLFYLVRVGYGAADTVSGYGARIR
jgi:hypothetical protein